MNIADLRRNYTLAGLDTADAAAEPFEQFERWFAQAINAQLAGEANAMTLATVSPDGKPSARIVLLKGVDDPDRNDRGFVFYTNYESRKGRELEGNPHACVVFFWAELERQVRVDGRVERVSAHETKLYFDSRPFGSRIGAWASQQSAVIENRTVLEEKFASLSQRYSTNDSTNDGANASANAGAVPVPPNWGGYRLIPSAIEFWQGRPSRLHDRLRYTRNSAARNGWRIDRLSP
jgi:pyridoxamine 5'-phosphate oxidase